jgi:hypothetical protein
MSPSFGLRISVFIVAKESFIVVPAEFFILGVALHSSLSVARNREEDLCIDPTRRCHRWILIAGLMCHAVA